MDEKFYELLEKLYVELLNTKTELKAEIQGVRTELKAEIQEVRDTMATKADLQEVKNDLQEVKSTMATKEDLELAVEDLKAEIQVVHDEVKELRSDFNMVEMVTNRNALEISKLKVAR